jgi:proton-coupled amino acid transporter
MDPVEYYYLNLWGENMEESDEDDPDHKNDLTWTAEEILKIKLAEPREKQKIKSILMKGHVTKLSNTMTFFTLLKGFIGTGVLFLPNGFYNGGWLFSSIALTCSMLLTLSCITLLMSVAGKQSTSYSDLGRRSMGQIGKFLCDLTLALSQTGFVIGHIVFILQNSRSIVESRLGFTPPSYTIGI